MRALLMLALLAVLPAEESPPRGLGDAARDPRVLWLNAGVGATVLVYGALAWDYGSADFHVESEGWFGAGTRYGGADKLGHAYTAYALGSGFGWVYERWGYPAATAAALGACSGVATQTLIELGDGLSEEHGFAWEDQVMNVAGGLAAYLRRRYPAVRERVDLRLEYWPSPGMREGDLGDVTTDYSGMKYVLALKAAGFVRGPAWLRCLELQGGYYTRGYRSGEEAWFHPRERVVYAAIGIDLTTLLGYVTDHPARHVFQYYQVPYTYLPVENDLER